MVTRLGVVLLGAAVVRHVDAVEVRHQGRGNERTKKGSMRRVAALRGPVKDAASRLAALGPVGPSLTGPLRFADSSARGR
jgi:hypothetical protein